ncbi:hypothetical protein [Bosea vaviloviae]|uniref:Uncharacterized protein n=1 Tax=Bosea vaviloviae TaxID=1526658 RepID=A0A1D7UCL0_9HYPH|nr:hypothetical protein [Bosea vaviloviae]AOO85105.1 hypothetical protein BHK69_30895 [Bosea vaviloviae]
MAGRFGFASLISPGLAVDGVDDSEGALVVTARSSALPDAITNAICASPDRRTIYVPTFMNEIYAFERTA